MSDKGNSSGSLDSSVNRRQFLRGTAAAALSFTIVKGSQVRGSEANSRIKVGMIGLGGRGSQITGMLGEHTGYQVAALADYFPKVVKKAGEKYGVAKERCFSGLSGYRKLIASGVDAVFCETPPYCFPEHVTAAVNAGAHVYLAKPVACDVPGCLKVAEMGRKATRTKKVFLVDFQTRTDPFFIEGIKRVHGGDIGKIGMLSSIYTDDGFRDPPRTKTIESRFQNLIWVNDIDLGGGMLVNADIHAVDVAQWIAQGTPVSAMGCSRVVKPDAHGDTKYLYSLTYQFKNGLILNHRGEHLRNTKGFSCSCFAYGSQGYLETNYGGKVWIRSNKKGYRGGQAENLYNEGIKRNLDTFHRNITNGIYDNVTVQSSVDSTLITILGREAAKNNTILTWDEMLRTGKKIEVDFSGLKA